MYKKYILILIILSLIQIKIACSNLNTTTRSTFNNNMLLELKLSKNNYIIGEYLTAQAIIRNKGIKNIIFDQGTLIGIEAKDINGKIIGFEHAYEGIGGYILKVDEKKKSYVFLLHRYLLNQEYLEKTSIYITAFVKNKYFQIETNPVEFMILPPSSNIDKEAFKYLLCPPPDIIKKAEERGLHAECPNKALRILLYEGGNEEVLDKYPQSTYAKYILYTNALSNLYPSNQAPKEKKYLNIAIANFERLIKDYPPFEFIDEAMYYLAVAYYHIDKKDKANEFLNQVIMKYPDSDGAEMAKQFIKDPAFGNKRGDI